MDACRESVSTFHQAIESSREGVSAFHQAMEACREGVSALTDKSQIACKTKPVV